MEFDPNRLVEFKLDIPKDTIRFGGRSGSEENFRKLAPSVQRQLIDASVEYHAQTGRKLQVNSAFRSEDDQKRLYDESVAAGRPGVGPTGMPIAKPGTSKHQRGIVVDIQQGKDDPIAQEILGRHGFVQNVKNDPVHFEYTGAPVSFQPKAPVAPAAPETAPSNFNPDSLIPYTQPTPQPEYSLTPLPPEQTTRQRVGQNVAAAGVGAAMGATAGLGQYLPAALLYGASQIAPQGRPLSFSEALGQVRETVGGIKEAAPTAYMGGEIGGGIAGFARLAGLRMGKELPGVGRQMAAGAGMGATTEITRAPETGLVDALIGGGVGGITAGLGGAAAKVIEKGGRAAGRYTISDTIRKLQQSNEPASREMLERILGPAFTAAQEKVAKEAAAAAAKGKPFSARRMEAEIRGLQNIDVFAQRYIKNPKLLEKYGVQDAITPYQQAAKIAPQEIKSAIGRAAVADVLQPAAASLGGAVGGAAGAGLGALLAGENPLAGAHLGMFSGGLTGAAAMGLGRYGAASYALSPALQSAVRLGSLGAIGAGYGATIPLSEASSDIRRQFRTGE